MINHRSSPTLTWYKFQFLICCHKHCIQKVTIRNAECQRFAGHFIQLNFCLCMNHSAYKGLWLRYWTSIIMFIHWLVFLLKSLTKAACAREKFREIKKILGSVNKTKYISQSSSAEWQRKEEKQLLILLQWRPNRCLKKHKVEISFSCNRQSFVIFSFHSFQNNMLLCSTFQFCIRFLIDSLFSSSFPLLFMNRWTKKVFDYFWPFDKTLETFFIYSFI